MGEESWRLVDCDIYRDGGSLGAVLATGDVIVSLFLQVQPWDVPPERMVYGALFVTNGQIPQVKERAVPRHEERLWLERLASCDLELREVEERWAEAARMHHRQLVAALRERQAQP